MPTYNPTAVGGNGNWLDLSNTSNRYIQMYVKGFVDVSGGNVVLRPNSHLILQGGDISLNGNLYVNGSSVGGGGGGGAISLNNVAVATTQQQQVTYDSVYNAFMTVKPATTTTNSTITFSTTNLTGDVSMNGRLFVTSDASFGGNLNVLGNLNVNGQSVGGGVTLANAPETATFDSNSFAVFSPNPTYGSGLNTGVSLQGTTMQFAPISLNNMGSDANGYGIVSPIANQQVTFSTTNVNINGNLNVGSNLTIGCVNLTSAGAALQLANITVTSNVSPLMTDANGCYIVTPGQGQNTALFSSTSLALTGNLTVGTATAGTNAFVVVGNTALTGNTALMGNVGIGKTTPQFPLDISGAIQSSNPSTGTFNNWFGKVPPTNTYLSSFTPNSVNATQASWSNNNVTWSASASSNAGGFYSPYTAFVTGATSNANTAADGWTSGSNSYNGTTSPAGNYVASSPFYTYINGVGSISGEWLQLQSNVPVAMNSFYLTTTALNNGNNNWTRLPKTFYICGSNDNNSWSPIIYGNWSVAPTASAALLLNTNTYTIPSGTTTGGTLAGGTATGPGTAVNLTYNTYGNSSNGYTYFRLVVVAIIGSSFSGWVDSGATNYASCFWTPSFSPATLSGPSKTLLYMDASNVNQLDVSGSLAVVNSNASSILVSPNTTAATSYTWINNNVTWQASASSTYSTWYPYYVFNNNTTSIWSNLTQTSYSQTTGNWTNTNPYITPIYDSGSAVTVSGEWLQLQSSIPLIMNKYYFMPRSDGANNYQCLLPATWKIVGSNDGTAWYSIQDASCTALPGISGTSVLQQSTSTYSITTNTSTVSQNSNANITGYSTAAKTYTYFRIIVQSILEGKFTINDTTAGNKGQIQMYFFPSFTPASSAVSLALDNAVPNQLNVGGSLCVAGSIGAGLNYPLNVLDVAASSTGLAGLTYRGIASDAGAKSFLSTSGMTNANLPFTSNGGVGLYHYSNANGTQYRLLVNMSTYFTGQHANLPVNSDLKINITNYVGLLVSSADQGYYSENQITSKKITGSEAITISEALPVIALTSVDKDPAVWGVITNVKNDNINTDGTTPTDNDNEFGDRLGNNMVRINGLGEGALWVTNINGNIKNGDWICSSIVPGYGRKQDDDLFHNYTAAKATMSCDFDINNDNLYQCKEVEYNGTTYLAAFIGVSYHCS